MMSIDEEKAKILISDFNEFETQGQTNAKDPEYDFDYIGFENVQLIEISHDIFIEPNNQVDNNNENIEQNISFPLNIPNEINGVEFLNKKRNLDTKASKSGKEKEKDLIQKEKTIQADAASNDMKFRNGEMKDDTAGIGNNNKLLPKNALSSSKKSEGVAHYRKKFSRRKHPHIKRKLFFENKIEEKKCRKKYKRH